MENVRDTQKEASRNVSAADKAGIAKFLKEKEAKRQEGGLPLGLLEALMGMSMQAPRPNSPLMDALLDHAEKSDNGDVKGVEYTEIDYSGEDFKEKEITLTVKVKDLTSLQGGKRPKVGKSTVTFKISNGTVSITGDNPANDMGNPAERTQGIVFSEMVDDFTTFLEDVLSARKV